MLRNFVLFIVSLGLSCSETHPAHEMAFKKELSPKESIKGYYLIRDSLSMERQKLCMAYKNALGTADKNLVLQKARALFISGITGKLIPYWYGTPWDFYGHGDTPRVNNVACGYFVAILLRDMGARVNVSNLAEGISGAMIEKLTAKSYIKKYRNMQHDAFYNTVIKDGDGLYIIGLDNHTGFLLCEKGKLFFIDSSWKIVRRHDPSDSEYLVQSTFRMTGKISDDPVFLKKWLTGVAFE